MADAPAEAIVQQLAEHLRAITVANGYHLDLGSDVNTEESEARLTAPRTTVAVTRMTRAEGGERRPGNGRRVEGVIEIAVPVDMDQARVIAYRAEDDVDRCLAQHNLLPGALPVQWEEAEFVNRPEGMPVLLVQVHWTTAFRRG